MSDLAIEWGSDRVVVLQGKASGKHINARKAAVIVWPEEIDPAKAPAQAGQWLGGELTSRGFSLKPALVSLPRESVVVRPLELPNVADAELPDIVRLQAATKVTLAADQYLLDFIPLPPRGSDSRDVLMTTVPTDVTSNITAVLTAAGVEIASIGVSSFNTGELVNRQMDAKMRAAQQLHLSVSKAGDRVEVALLRGNCALATSSTRVTGAADAHKAINAEINRLRLSAQQLHGGLPVSRIWVTPNDAAGQALGAFLNGRIHAEVECLDPLGGTGDVEPSQRGHFAAVAGHLLGHGASQTETVNYLSPRKAIEKRDTRKLKMALIGGGVALALFAGWWAAKSRAQSINDEAEFMEQHVAEINSNVNANAKDVESAKLLGGWEDSAVDWLDEMDKLNKTLPGGDLAVVDTFTFSPGRSGQRPVVHMEGNARGRAEVKNFADKLQRQGYSVESDTEPGDRADEGYETSFKLDAILPAADSKEEKK